MCHKFQKKKNYAHQKIIEKIIKQQNKLQKKRKKLCKLVKNFNLKISRKRKIRIRFFY